MDTLYTKQNHIKVLTKLNTLSVNPTKWSNTLKQIRRLLPTNCLSMFDHFVGLALKGLTNLRRIFPSYKKIEIN